MGETARPTTLASQSGDGWAESADTAVGNLAGAQFIIRRSSGSELHLAKIRTGSRGSSQDWRLVMKLRIMFFTGLMAGIGLTNLAASTEGLAQTRTLTEAECKAVRERLAEHARLSDGVRRDLANRAPWLPAAQPPAAAPAPTAGPGRAEAIRARLEKIPAERQRLEDERLGAYLRLELGRASQIAQQIQALDAEKANLEKELPGLPATPAGAPQAPAVPAATRGASSDADRIPCQDLSALLAAAVRIRQRELGAKEGQAGVVPLVALKGQFPDQIAQELAAQFAAWPGAAAQVGLLDQDGRGRLDAFVDAPAPNVFRLYRQRTDGTVSVDVFNLPGRPGDLPFGEMPRRVEEATIRQTRGTLADLLAVRPGGPVRILGETGDFGRAQAFVLAGNYGDAARVEGGGARTTDFQNLRGESVRVVEMIAPAPNGLLLRRVVATARQDGEEQWEETTTILRPVSSWRTDVEVRRATERRSAAGVSLAPRSASAPVAFAVDR